MKKTTYLFKIHFLTIFALLSFISYAQSIATYTITFTGTWNPTDHTQGGISFPSSDHWSDLVGATHNADVKFWETGQMATLGVEDVAERGDNDEFLNEVNDAISVGDADQWLQKSFEIPNIATSSATLMNITVSEDFPLLTLITMIAPSPDWFAGIRDVSLRNGGNWESSITIDLFPYDAGTEEGVNYSTSNSATSPQETITSLVNVAPFNDEKVGTISITLQSVLSTDSQNFKNGVSVSPNPSKGLITISNLTNETISSIELYDVIGKQVKNIKFNTSASVIRLNIGDLNAGIYLAKINSDSGNSSTKKLIIN